MKRALIEAAWAKNPAATIEQVRRATGAPSATVRHVYAQLLAAGRLTRPKHVTRDHWRAVA
jgi:hypothetical protein